MPSVVPCSSLMRLALASRASRFLLAESSSREMTDFLRTRGYTVAASEVADGTGWPSWKYRNDAVLEHLFPISE